MGKKKKAQASLSWKPPRVIDIGQVAVCSLAIRSVELEGKPIVEVMTLPAKLSDLRLDLKECLERERAPREIKFWIRKGGGSGRYRYGFYREAWTLHALDFLDRTKLSKKDHSWISGLLFGYESRGIQKFIERHRRLKKGSKRAK
jgi:hypothetical protein